MKNRLVGKTKEILRKPWTQSGLAGAFVAFLIMSIYYSEDRWTSLGVIGTWATGAFAAIIAWIQYKEQKLKITDIKLSVEKEVENKCAIFASSLINICTEISSWSERFSINNSGHTSVLYILDLAENRSHWQEIQIQSYQREAVGHELTQHIDDFNRLMKTLPMLLRKYLFITSANQFETLNRYHSLVGVMLASSKSLESLEYDHSKEVIETITNTQISLNRIKSAYPNMSSAR